MNSIKYTKEEKPRTPCTVRGCSTTFSRKADWYRHVAEVHGYAKKCPVKGCSWKNAKYEGRLKAHMTTAHAEVFIPVPLDIPSPAWGSNVQSLGETSNVVSEESSYVYPPPMDFDTLQSGPDETQFETPGDIKNWYPEYQSDEHASENNHWEYDSTSGSMDTTSIADASKNHANLDPTTLDYMSRGLNTEETTHNEAVIQEDLEGVEAAGKELGHESQTQYPTPSLSSHTSLSGHPLSSELSSPNSAPSFRPIKYEWEDAPDWDEPVVFQTSTFKNSHYNVAHKEDIQYGFSVERDLQDHIREKHGVEDEAIATTGFFPKTEAEATAQLMFQSSQGEKKENDEQTNSTTWLLSKLPTSPDFNANAKRVRRSTFDSSTRPIILAIPDIELPLLHQIGAAKQTSLLQKSPYGSRDERYIDVPATSSRDKNQQRYTKQYSATIDNADINRLSHEHQSSPRVFHVKTTSNGEPTKFVFPDDDDHDDSGSDISRSSSVASISDSIFSLISGSSMSSRTGSFEAGERLVLLLVGDEGIRSTCEQGVQWILADRFERNMRRLLKTFAAELKKEAESPAQRQAANFVRYRARNSAHRIRNTFYKDKEEDDPRSGTTAAVPPFSATHPSSVGGFEQQEDSEESDGVELEDEPDDLQDLERFLKSSAAMIALCESLRAFVCPLKELHAVPEPTSEKDAGLLREQDDDSSKAEIVNPAVDSAPSENGSNNTSILASEDDPEVTKDFTTISPENMDGLELLNKENHPPNKESNLLMQKSTPTENDKMPIEKVGRTLREAVKSAMQKLGIRLEMVLFGTTHLLRRSTPLEGKTRIKWKCRCGYEICDDFIELVPGAAERYRQNMEQKYLLRKEKKVASSISGILTSALLVHGLFLSVYIFGFGSTVMIFENFEAFSLNSQMATAHSYTAVYLLVGIWAASWLFTNGWPYSSGEPANPENRQCNTDSRSKRIMNPIHRAFYKGRRLFRIFRHLLSGGITDIDLELPTFNVSNETSDEREPQTVPPSDLLFLLLCYSEGRYATKLLQLDLVKLQATSDKMLFKLLHANYESMRGKWFSSV
ncbi:uncharacterized protein PAC_17501 [Phialocephala subalpina]|uniref:C2H2-type domain-containing protein n=1 Tax=Phialocephala subalpina TaxID=576137 RepID=A0A1L7XRB5_9HELO|nr:uncharacterized protein PAC_17501 [Phialocephala subalpina]